MLNKVIIMGRLTAYPELKYTTSGTPVTSFAIACNRDFKDANGNNATDFFDVIAWRERAEFATKYLQKGRQIAVEGSLQTRKYTDKNGSSHKVVEIVASSIYFADSKAEGKKEGDAAPAFEASSSEGFTEVSGDEDLPF